MRRVERDQRVVTRAFTPEVTRRFGEMADLILSRWASSPSVIAALVGVDEGNIAMAQTLAAIWVQSGIRAGAQIAEFIDAPVNPEMVNRLRTFGGSNERRSIRGIRAVTRREVRRTISLGQEAGLTARDIATGRGRRARLLAEQTGWRPLNQVVRETYSNRALTIARTETALAHQYAANMNYDYHGLTHVEWLDSPDCGVRNHNDAEKANGQIVTLARNAAYPLSHPNCVRASAPVVESIGGGRVLRREIRDRLVAAHDHPDHVCHADCEHDHG